MSILNQLPKLKTSKDFESAIKEAHAESSAFSTKILELEGHLTSAYFDPSKRKPEDIRKEIGKAKEDREILLKLIDELELRREKAFQAEVNAEIEASSAEARKTWELLRQTYLTLNAAAKKAAKSIQEIRTLEQDLHDANKRAREHSRGDLVVPPPLGMLTELIGRQTGFGFDVPEKIQGYLPEHPDGNPLWRLKELKL